MERLVFYEKELESLKHQYNDEPDNNKLKSEIRYLTNKYLALKRYYFVIKPDVFN